MEGAGNIGGTVYTVVNEAGVGSRVQVGIWHVKPKPNPYGLGFGLGCPNQRGGSVGSMQGGWDAVVKAVGGGV